MLGLIFLTVHQFARAQDYYFPPLFGNYWETTSADSLGWCAENIDSLFTFLENTDTKAFIVLKDGRIVIEEYFNGSTSTSFNQWNSAGKTITSFLVGVAQEEGYLSIQEPTSNYLGQGWTSCDSVEESKIKIIHHLTMTTAMNDFIFNCNTPNCLLCIDEPGERWAYHNGPYRLLTDVVVNATGQTYNSYTNQKLKNKIGMNGLWYITESYDLFYSSARSMARFGSLILNNSIWNGDTLLHDPAYKTAMVTPSQTINESYGYLWWLNGYSSHMIPGSQIVFPGYLDVNAPPDLYMAAGKDGQFCDIIPSENMVVIRMGDSSGGDATGVQYHRDMWAKITPVIMGPDTLNWTGSVNNAWAEKSNWDKNCLPGKRTHVIISDATSPVVITDNHEIGSLYLSNENMLIIENGAQLKINKLE